PPHVRKSSGVDVSASEPIRSSHRYGGRCRRSRLRGRERAPRPHRASGRARSPARPRIGEPSCRGAASSRPCAGAYREGWEPRGAGWASKPHTHRPGGTTMRLKLFGATVLSLGILAGACANAPTGSGPVDGGTASGGNDTGTPTPTG